MARYQIIIFLIGKNSNSVGKKCSTFVCSSSRNARDHVQPFVLVQFKDLPYERLISVTCRLWYPGVEHETRTMRSMVTFQLYRTQSQAQVNPIETEEETQ